jgi:hypothetical protein
MKQKAMEEARGWRRQERRKQLHTAQSAVELEPAEQGRNEALETTTAPEVQLEDPAYEYYVYCTER